MSVYPALPISLSSSFSRSYTPPFEDYSRPPLDPNIFNDILVIQTLSTAKFSVYLIFCKANSIIYALKLYTHKVHKSEDFFLNEIRFCGLSHPNVIRMLHFEKGKPSPVLIKEEQTTNVPYAILEYAPYGDFFDIFKNYKAQIDDKLIRTFFRQLIDGIEYLHIKGIAHLDLKLENLLLGEDYLLKISDFDISYIMGDEKVLSKGTKHYRAPEVLLRNSRDHWAVDMYSAGIILFIFKTRGLFPYLEDKQILGHDFRELLYGNNQLFWEKHLEIIEQKNSFFDWDFKRLFNGMVRENPNTRFTIDDVKKSNWYNGPVYTKNELERVCIKIFKG